MDAKRSPIQLLSKLSPAERLVAIDVAWPHAAAEERQRFAWLALDLADAGNGPVRRKRRGCGREIGDHALGLLLRGWSDVTGDVQKLALAVGRGRWAAALESLGDDGVLTAGRSIGALANATDDAAFLPALGRVLREGPSKSVQASARALLAAALRRVEPIPAEWIGTAQDSAILRQPLDPEPPVWRSADVQVLLNEVAKGARTFEVHGRRELLLAALVLLEGPRRRLCPADPLATIARDPESVAFASLRAAFRRGRVPLARQRAWVWLREDSLAAACLERLGSAKTPAEHQVVLDRGVLSLAPARCKRLAILPVATRPAPARTTPPGVSVGSRLHPGGPVPDRAAVERLTVSARRMLPRWVSALDGTQACRVLALEGLLTDTDPVTRLASARAVPGSDVRDYCFDAASPIARHAALRVSSLGVAESSRSRGGDASRRNFARTLVRSPHTAVRAIGKQELDRVRVGQRPVLSRLAARRLWLADADAFAHWMGEAIEGPVTDAVDAIMTARQIGAVACVEGRLLSIVRDSIASPGGRDPRMVATAVACLGQLSSTRVVSLLEGCLFRHTDPRVRSNAAEALGRQRRLPDAAKLEGRMLADEHHRVRGSVARATIAIEPKPGSKGVIHAIDLIGEMLTDSRSSHRLAGVWVVQRSLGAGGKGAFGARWARLVGRVRWLGDEDADAAIRRRAGVVTHRVDAAMVGLGPNAAGVVAS